MNKPWALMRNPCRGGILAFVLFGLVSMVPVQAGQNPAWWSASATRIWSYPAGAPVPPTEHAAAVNVGQLKHVATQAKAYLESRFGPIDWDAAYAPEPKPFPFNASLENHHAANVGQLKAVTYGFYKILHEHGYPTRKSLLFQGVPATHMSEWDGVPVPWGSLSLSIENKTLVNLGQLKLAFSFSTNINGSSTFNLGGIIDDLSSGADDQNGDLWSNDLAGFMGLGSGYITPAQVLAGDVPPAFAQALQALPTTPPGGASYGPVLVVPGRGYVRVTEPKLTLLRL